MSSGSNIVKTLSMLDSKFNFSTSVKNMTDVQKKEYLLFRSKFIQEENDELLASIMLNNKDGIVDACIDVAVVALGTLQSFGIDVEKAWQTVADSNLQKELGTNPKRSANPNMPDLVKPVGWQEPCHKDNVGVL